MGWPGAVAEASGVAGRALSAPKSELSVDGWERSAPKLNPHGDFELAQAHTDDKTSPAEPAAKSTNQPHHIWEGGKAAQAVSVPSR